MLKRGRPFSYRGFSPRLQATGFLTHAFSAKEARDRQHLLGTAKYINPPCRIPIPHRYAIYGLSSSTEPENTIVNATSNSKIIFLTAYLA
jgi:hypothetical protein